MPGYARDPNVGAGGTSIVSFQDEPPSSPTLGQIWVDSNTNIFYADSNDYLSNLTASALYVSKASASSTYALKTLYQSASAPALGTGQFWVNSTNNNLYVYNGSSFVPAGSTGAAGGGSDKVFYENDTIITTDYTITAGKNAMSTGPITINNGVTVTVPSGSTWTVI